MKTIGSFLTALLVLCTLSLFSYQAEAQTRAVIATTLTPSPTGYGSVVVYGSYYIAGQTPVIPLDGEVDSVWNVIQTTGKIGNLVVWTASEVIADDTSDLKIGRYQTYNIGGESQTYQGPPQLVAQFKTSYYSPVFFEAKNVDVTASGGTVTVGIPNANFVVTAVTVVGANDTTGYTSNATLAIGTNSTSYNNLVASVAPPLGGVECLSATLVSPRIFVPAGTAIVVKNSTAAVSTTEHATILVQGVYIH